MRQYLWRTSLKPKAPPKVGFKWGGVSGGGRPKSDWGMCLLDKIMIFQGFKPTIQPLGVEYVNKPKMGVCGVFLYMQACVVLI